MLTNGNAERQMIEAQTGSNAERVSLERAMQRFYAAGARLEAKYESLHREVEELRRRLREKDAEIARSARLAMLGETAAAIAHEVRNPLGSIKLFLSLLRQDVSDRAESLRLVDQINRSVLALDNVVNNILHFAKNRTLQFSPLNLHSLLQEQISMLLSGESKGLQVVLDLKGNPYVRASECGMRQVFYNILLNAAQAMCFQGTLIVRSSDLPDGGLELTIKDNGPGVREDILAKIFEPFVTTRPQGTGLGLAIARQIIEQHQGSIEVKNANGAVFILRLPRVAGVKAHE
mgnify:CR=1 FL=1